MLLPFREHLDFGPTPYDQLQAKEGIPIIKGNVVADVTGLGARQMGRARARPVAISIFPISTDRQPMCARVALGGQTLPQAASFEEIIVCRQGAAHSGLAGRAPAKSPLNGRRARSSPFR